MTIGLRCVRPVAVAEAQVFQLKVQLFHSGRSSQLVSVDGHPEGSAEAVKPYRLRGEFAGLAPTSSLLGRGAEREIYDRRGRARMGFLVRRHAAPGECQEPVITGTGTGEKRGYKPRGY